LTIGAVINTWFANYLDLGFTTSRFFNGLAILIELNRCFFCFELSGFTGLLVFLLAGTLETGFFIVIFAMVGRIS